VSGNVMRAAIAYDAYVHQRNPVNQKPQLPRGLDPRGEMQALLRAQQRACETAARTGTPLVIYRDGKIEFVQVTELSPPVDEGNGSAYSPS
jgi:hypothetical protein